MFVERVKLVIESLVPLKEAKRYSQIPPKSMSTVEMCEDFENDAFVALILLVNKGPRDFFVDTRHMQQVSRVTHGSKQTWRIIARRNEEDATKSFCAIPILISFRQQEEKKMVKIASAE